MSAGHAVAACSVVSLECSGAFGVPSAGMRQNDVQTRQGYHATVVGTVALAGQVVVAK